jgi:hypothetical protein
MVFLSFFSFVFPFKNDEGSERKKCFEYRIPYLGVLRSAGLGPVVYHNYKQHVIIASHFVLSMQAKIWVIVERAACNLSNATKRDAMEKTNFLRDGHAAFRERYRWMNENVWP